jgi:hypothetical protein
MATVGGCQCGGVSLRDLWRSSGTRRECQKQSASAFGMSLQVKRADFRITRGEARSWSRGTDSGNRLKCFFCPHCGSRIWHENDPPLDSVTVKAGSLDQSVDASDAIHIHRTKAKRQRVSLVGGPAQLPAIDRIASKIKFALDSPLEQRRFELSVPPPCRDAGGLALLRSA